MRSAFVLRKKGGLGARAKRSRARRMGGFAWFRARGRPRDLRSKKSPSRGVKCLGFAAASRVLACGASETNSCVAAEGQYCKDLNQGSFGLAALSAQLADVLASATQDPGGLGRPQARARWRMHPPYSRSLRGAGDPARGRATVQQGLASVWSTTAASATAQWALAPAALLQMTGMRQRRHQDGKRFQF